ncbi:MAG: hypothetical protein WBD40_09070 [Tepidisphaeraceae bacterium]
MTEAIFGLLGVLAGVALAGFKDVLIERRREQRMMRVSIRVLLAELGNMAVVAKQVRDRGRWKAVEPRPRPAAIWSEHLTALADLDDALWNAIDVAVSYAEHIETSIRVAPGERLSEPERAIVEKAIKQFEAAAYALITYRAFHRHVGDVTPRRSLSRRVRTAVRAPFSRARYKLRRRRYLAGRDAAQAPSAYDGNGS